MTSVRPVYPNSIFSWTDKVDKQDVDFAIDVNSLASDLISVESTLGTNAHVESSPPTGTSVKYASVSARISDAMNNNELPVSELTSAKLTMPNNTAGQLNHYRANYDPYSMFNGTDISIVCNGWWYVSATQTWQGWDDGYSHLMLQLNGSIVDENLLNWEFAGNIIPVILLQTGGSAPPGSVTVTPRWQQFGGKRNITTTVTFQGLAKKGDRFSAVSENGTSNASHIVTNLSMKASMLRHISGNFTSG